MFLKKTRAHLCVTAIAISMSLHASETEAAKLASPALQPIKTLKGHEDYTMAITFSPTGDRMLSIDERGVLIVWRTKDWKQERSFKIGEQGTSVCIAISNNGKYVAVCHEVYQVGKARVWDLSNGKPLGPPAGFVGYFHTLKVSNDGHTATAYHYKPDEILDKPAHAKRKLTFDAIKGKTTIRPVPEKEKTMATVGRRDDWLAKTPSGGKSPLTDKDRDRIKHSENVSTVHPSHRLYAVSDWNNAKVYPSGADKPLMTINSKEGYAWPWGMAFSNDERFFAVEDRTTHNIEVFRVK